MGPTAEELEAIRTAMPAAVPFVRTLGLEYLQVEAARAVLRMPDRPDLHNHVAGPHAGAMFSLGESASGAVVMGTFGDLLDRATPLAASAEISYVALARGDVVAEARLAGDQEAVRAELAGGGLPKFAVDVEIRDAGDRVTARMTVRWALKPHASRA